MRYFIIGGGLFILIFACIIPLNHNIREYEVQKRGEIIVATITEIPDCFGTRLKHFMRFSYGGRFYDKAIGCSFANSHKVGETIKFRHLKDTDIFLFENEKKERDFIATGLLALLSILIIIIGAKGKAAHNNRLGSRLA